MRFHDYKTYWEQFKNHPAVGGPTEFYSNVKNDPETSLVSQMICAAEHAWIIDSKPYYKVWPSYVAMLSRTSLDVPCEFVRLPHPVFAIRFPTELELLNFPFGRLGSVLVCSAKTLDGLTAIKFVMDDATGKTLRNIFVINVSDPDKSVSDCIEETWTKSAKHSDEIKYSTAYKSDYIATGMTLAVAVSMLATSVHRAVEHDVIEKLRERYDNATTDAERSELAEKSKRRGVFGFRIGRGRDLGLTTLHGEKPEGGGSELSFQHIRGGHFHTVCHGPNHSLRKVVFFEPTIVRPDLPVRPIAAD